MRRTLALVVAIVAAGIGCAPREQPPPGVRALRGQRRRPTIELPVWSADAAAEVAAKPEAYRHKTLVIQRAYLDPSRRLAVGKELARLPLRGGGVVLMAAKEVPGWLRQGTGAPLRLRAALHPAVRGDGRDPRDLPVLRGLAVDLAHPLELAFIEIERAKEATWLVAHVENYRDRPGGAILSLRYGPQRSRAAIAELRPGYAAVVRLKLAGPSPPPLEQCPPEARRLTVEFDDGSTLEVDVGSWLTGPAATLLDWGYSFTPPGNAVLAVAADRPEAELERSAALDLRSYLARFTDANIEPREPDAETKLAKQPLLVVGTPRHNALAGELVRQAKLQARLASVGTEGYVLKTLAYRGCPALLVTANSARGIVHGIYGLLEHYGVWFSMAGSQMPPRGEFRLVEVDEARAPLFATRRLVARGRRPYSTALWSQWRWITMFDLAAKNRCNEVVMPFDGLEATFTYQAGRSRQAVFPFAIGPYTCLAEAYLAHQRGLLILADYARRLGLDLGFACHGPDGKLRRVAPPACVSLPMGPGRPGDLIEVLEDPGDAIGMPRLEEAAATVTRLLRSKEPVLSVPYTRGGSIRAGFLARRAWDKELTPAAYYLGWAKTLCKGEAAGLLAQAIQGVDALDGDIIAAAPRPLGHGPEVASPVEEGDLECHWARLRARATAPAAKARREALRDQARKLREIQRKLDPIHTAARKALGSVSPPWEEPLFEAAPATQRAARVSRGFFMLRSMLSAFAAAQEGALAYCSALAEPKEAVPRLQLAFSRTSSARHVLRYVAREFRGAAFEPALLAAAAALEVQEDRLRTWLGPVVDARPSARLAVEGSEAIVHLFLKDDYRIYAAYMPAGRKVVSLRLKADTVRVFRRGQPPQTVRAAGGAFLVDLGTVPVYIMTRQAAWPGRRMP